uniref:PWWP domain-containing protein n=1 Tax=Anopheles dirus TaxID=7168 RepID=A0A182MZQ3_9DIPT
MAAARADNGSRQDDTIIQPMQRPKGPPQPAQPTPPPSQSPGRYPTIFLNARKQVARAPVPVPSRQHVGRRLAPAQPRCHLQPRPPPPAPVPGMVTATNTTATTTTTSTGPLLISADSIRRTVYATFPSMSFETSTGSGAVNGLTNTIVSFAGKKAITIPVQSVNPTPPATARYKLVASAGTPKKRMPLLAPKPAGRNGEQTLAPVEQPEAKPLSITAATLSNGGAGRTSTAPYNNAPGWRRILRNKVIVYISPSNIVLHNYEQAKEYLLTAGTCKCGLPCPFNPERFFQFDAQVPNVTMAPKAHAVHCAHLKQAISSDVRPERTKRLHAETAPQQPPPPPLPATVPVRPAPSAILLKTPPWRKNVPDAAAVRLGVPVAPDRASPEQKKPTFKDDPTGYLNQQTAILHSSISFLHSPDRRSPLPVGGPGSPVAPETPGTSGNRGRPARPPIAQWAAVGGGLPKEASNAKPPMVKYEPAKPIVVCSQGGGKPPARMAYYVKANASPGEQQCTSAKVAKLNLATPVACPVTTLTTTTTTTIARTHPISTPVAPTPRATPHVISTVGGAQIVVIDGLQHSAMAAGGGARLGGFPTHGLRPPQPAQPPPQTVPKPTAALVNYSLAARPPNGTTVGTPSMALSLPTTTTTNHTPTSSSGAVILNGTNIIHLSNGLAPAGSFGGILQTHPDPSGSPKTASLALPTNGTLVLNPAGTSIRFATDGTGFHHATPATASFVRPSAANTTTTTTTYHYAPVVDGASARKVKRQLKGAPLVLQPAVAQAPPPPPPVTTTFHQQLQPAAGPFMQIATPYAGLQNIQLAPTGLSGLTVVPVSKAQPQQQPQPQPQPPQQQPYNLLGQAQTILLPAGSMVMTSDAATATTTLLQIQPPLLAGQTGLVLRQPKPQPAASFLAAPAAVAQPSYLVHPRIAPHRPLAPAPTQPAPGTIFASLPLAPATLASRGAPPVPATEPAPGCLDGAKRVEPGGTVLLHPDTVELNARLGCVERDTKVSPDLKHSLAESSSLSVAGSEPDNGTGRTIALQSPLLLEAATGGEQKKGWMRENTAKQPGEAPLGSNRTGRVLTPRLGTARPAGIAVRRTAGVPSVQPAHGKQLPVTTGKLLTTTVAAPAAGAAPTCLLAEVLPEQSYDAVSSARSLPQPAPVAATPLSPFRVGDLVWGAVRGFPAWPGKVLREPCDDVPAQQQHQQPPDQPARNSVWVRWFGTGRTNAERVDVATLRSLSEGLDMHHRAQKDARKSRKLNAQLEQAIQEAMQELDRAATGPAGYGRAGTTTTATATAVGGGRYRRRRPLRHQPPGKHHPVRAGTGGTGSTLCNRRTGTVRYLRGNKFKAKS